MLHPRELNTTSLIVATADRTLPEGYREACILELADRIDHPTSRIPNQSEALEQSSEIHRGVVDGLPLKV